MIEERLKHWLVCQLGSCWTNTIVPARGSSFGFADQLLLVPEYGLLWPVELKLARWNRVGRVVPYRVRPEQIAWHDRLARAGGRSRFVLGLWREAGWSAYVLDDCRRETLASWRQGFDPAALRRVATDGKLDLAAWWDGAGAGLAKSGGSPAASTIAREPGP